MKQWCDHRNNSLLMQLPPWAFKISFTSLFRKFSEIWKFRQHFSNSDHHRWRGNMMWQRIARSAHRTADDIRHATRHRWVMWETSPTNYGPLVSTNSDQQNDDVFENISFIYVTPIPYNIEYIPFSKIIHSTK